MKNNRIKKTKQTKHKRQTKQTKHKRRMQYGGKTYRYLDYSEILKKDAPQKKVVIPGYAEISDMIKEYTDYVTIQKQLDNGIRTKNVVVYNSCEIPTTPTPPTTIILLRKDSFFSSSTIDCDDKIYLMLASHNFQIFIKDILTWNPFLQKTNNHEKTEEPPSQFYGSRHMYNTGFFTYQFTQESWWDSQQWWNVYKLTLPTYASLVPTPTSPPIPTEVLPLQQPVDDKEATIRDLKIEVDRLTMENQDLRKQIQELQLTRGETKKDR